MNRDDAQSQNLMQLIDHYCEAKRRQSSQNYISELRAAVEAALLAPQADPVAWRWKERDRFFNWTTDWEHHDKAKAMGCEIEYATPSAPTAGEPEFVNLPTVEELTAMLAVRPVAPTAKPLFGEMIAQHPGLREEIAADAERAEFEAWCDSQPIKPFPMHMAAKAFAAGFAARASKGTK